MSTASPACLSTFWDLASVDATKRTEAASALVVLLTDAQAAAGAEEACSDLTYTVRRLVRGLASARDGARQGFGAALIEVLRTFGSAVPLTGVVEVMDEAMQLHGSMHGAEERDVLFGRIFTCAALLRSGRLAAEPAPKRASLAETVAKELAFCSGKKSFLQELCAVLQCELFEALPAAEVQSVVWPQIAPLFAAPLSDWSPHALLVALRLGRKLPSASCAALLPHITMQDGALLNLTNLPALVPPLKAASISHPRLHAVWEDILTHGLHAAGSNTSAETTPPPSLAGPGGTTPSSKKSKKAAKKGSAAATAAGEPTEGSTGGGVDASWLRAFWQAVVEEGLVPSTLERKYVAFLLLQRASETLDAAHVPMLLSPALLRCLVNALEGHDRLLRPAANATLTALAHAAESSSNLRAALVSGLLGRGRGAGDYDRLASTKALRQLLATAPSLAGAADATDSESSVGYLCHFFATGHAQDSSGANAARKALAAGESEDDVAGRQRDQSRIWALDQLLVLSRSTLQRSRAPPAKAPNGKHSTVADPPDATEAKASANGATEVLPTRTLRFFFAHAFWTLPEAPKANVRSPQDFAAGKLLESLGGLPSPPPSPTVRRACADRFLSVLGETCAAATSAAASHSGGGDGASGNGGFKDRGSAAEESAASLAVLDEVSSWWAEMSAGGATLITHLSKSETAALAASQSLVDNLRRGRTSHGQGAAASAALGLAPAGVGDLRKLRALEVFTRHMQVQLLINPRPAASALDELVECAKEIEKNAAERAAGHVMAAAGNGAGGAANGKRGRNARGPAAGAAGQEEDTEADKPEDTEERPAVAEVIADLVLSVLAQPSATLRDVGKTVIKAFGDEMGEAALDLFVEVLRASPQDVEEDEEDEEDDDEDDDDEDEDDDEDDDEDEEDDDMADAGEEDEDEALAVANALDRAAFPVAGDEEGGEEEDDEEAMDTMPEDPSEMAAVDRQLGAMLRLRMDRRNIKKERQQQQLHFKLRVVDLLEALARRAAPPPSLVTLPLPLVRIMAAIAPRPSDRPLIERISGLIRNRLAKLAFKAPWPSDALPEARLLEELKSLLSLAEKLRIGGSEVASALSESVLFLLRLMAQHRMATPGLTPGSANVATASDAAQPATSKAGKKNKKRPAAGDDGNAPSDGAGAAPSGRLTEQVVSLLEGCLTRFYTHKNCRIHTKLLGEILKRQPALGWALAPTIIRHVSAARDGYLCAEACSQLEILLQTHGAYMASAKAAAGGNPAPSPLVPLLPEITTHLSTLLSREGMKAKHLQQPLRLTHAVLKLARQCAPNADSVALATALSEAVDAMRGAQTGGSGKHSVQSQGQKILSLAAQIQGGDGPGGGGGGQKQKQRKK